MHRDDGEVVVVPLADLFAARQPVSSPLSPAGGLDLPHLTWVPEAEPAPDHELAPDHEPALDREPEPDPEPAPEPQSGPAPVALSPELQASVVRIAPAYALRPLSDALCPECGEPRHSVAAHQHAE